MCLLGQQSICVFYTLWGCLDSLQYQYLIAAQVDCYVQLSMHPMLRKLIGKRAWGCISCLGTFPQVFSYSTILAVFKRSRMSTSKREYLLLCHLIDLSKSLLLYQPMNLKYFCRICYRFTVLVKNYGLCLTSSYTPIFLMCRVCQAD